MKVKWTEEAVADAKANVDYLLERNHQAAAIVLGTIEDATKKLTLFPLIGPELAGSGFRCLTVIQFGYVIVYHVNEDAIDILNVHHGRTDWLSRYG